MLLLWSFYQSLTAFSHWKRNIKQRWMFFSMDLSVSLYSGPPLERVSLNTTVHIGRPQRSDGRVMSWSNWSAWLWWTEGLNNHLPNLASLLQTLYELFARWVREKGLKDFGNIWSGVLWLVFHFPAFILASHWKMMMGTPIFKREEKSCWS